MNPINGFENTGDDGKMTQKLIVNPISIHELTQEIQIEIRKYMFYFSTDFTTTFSTQFSPII